MTRPYAEVIGDPISHSKSPLIHNFWLKKLGIDAEYRACHVTPDELGDYFARRRGDTAWRGCNVTIPHKVAALGFIDKALEAVTVTGALNTVFRVHLDEEPGDRLAGNNTDLRGFAEPLRESPNARSSALILGAGGAARAVYVALAGLGYELIEVAARDLAKAKAFLSDLGAPTAASHSLYDIIPKADLLVNATSLGMTGQPTLDIDLSQMPQGAIVYDLVYSPLETALLERAKSMNLQVIDGLTMLIGQADHAFRHFFGGEPPRQYDAELRAWLSA